MKLFVLISCGFFSFWLQAGDMSRYPYDTACYSANIEKCYDGAYEGCLPLSFQVGMDSAFTPRQKRILDESCKKFLSRALSNEVIDTAFSFSTRDMPKSKEFFRSQVYEALRPILVSDVVMPAFIFIASYVDDPTTVGIGYVNLYNDTDHPLPGFKNRHYLHIALNQDYVDSSTYSYGKSSDYWAGVIAHEILHNLGYKHPGKFVDSFIKVYGKSVRMNGKMLQACGVEGDELDDRVVEKDM